MKAALILQDWELRIHSDFAAVFKSLRHKYHVGRDSAVGVANRHTNDKATVQPKWH
jgi:hypothetical protein